MRSIINFNLNRFNVSHGCKQNKMKILFVIGFTLFCCCTVYGQNVGIGTATPNASAKVDISSTNKGFLPPRMTMAQRDSIQNPAAGLVIWCTNCDEMQVYNGIIWKNFSGTSASGTTIPNVKIGNQTWALRNLNVGSFSNGDPIPVVTDPVVWSSLTTPARCFYYNDSANYTREWGTLYNWYAASDPRGLAPQGWHVPSDSEWTVLVNYLGGEDSAGGRMKSTSSYYWLPPNTGASNSSGFTAIPAGLRDINGVFQSWGSDGGFWWSTTPVNATLAWNRYVVYDAAWCFKGSGSYKRYGLSVRCIKN